MRRLEPGAQRASGAGSAEINHREGDGTSTKLPIVAVSPEGGKAKRKGAVARALA
jgi:hypothetical protein